MYSQIDTLIKFCTPKKQQPINWSIIIKIVSDISLVALSISMQSNCVVFVLSTSVCVFFLLVFACCHINLWITNYTFFIPSFLRVRERERCISVCMYTFSVQHHTQKQCTAHNSISNRRKTLTLVYCSNTNMCSICSLIIE